MDVDAKDIFALIGAGICGGIIGLGIMGLVVASIRAIYYAWHHPEESAYTENTTTRGRYGK